MTCGGSRWQIPDKELRLSIDTAFGGKYTLNVVVRRQRSDLEQDGVLKFDGLIKRPSEGQITSDKRCSDNEDGKAREETTAQRGNQHDRSTIHPTPLTLRMADAPSFFRIAWIRNSTALLSTSSFQP